MKYSTLVFVFTLLIFTISCGDSNDPSNPSGCSTEFAETFQDEIQTINTTTQNYANDPSTANCEAFKEAYQNYINALDSWEECANFYNQVAQWEQAIDAAQLSIDNIVC